MNRDARLTDKAIAEKAAKVNEALCTSGTIRETEGSNRSPEIDRIEARFGLKGESYCAMLFWTTRFKAVAFLLALPVVDDDAIRRMKALHEQVLGPCATGCAEIVADYHARGQWLEVRPEGHRQGTAAAIATFRAQIQPGDAVIYDWGGGEHHIECFLRWEHGNMVTGAGNVIPDGGGVQGAYLKRRPLDANVWGCVRFNRGS